MKNCLKENLFNKTPLIEIEESFLSYPFAVSDLIEELIEGQTKTLLKLGRRLIPSLTPEDILQPNDYPQLENHPDFRYEEGVLSGLKTVQMALTQIHKAPTEAN